MMRKLLIFGLASGTLFLIAYFTNFYLTQNASALMVVSTVLMAVFTLALVVIGVAQWNAVDIRRHIDFRGCKGASGNL